MKPNSQTLTKVNSSSLSVITYITFILVDSKEINQTIMEDYLIYLVISIIVGALAYSFFYTVRLIAKERYLKYEEKLKAMREYVDNQRQDSHEIMMMINTINKRRQKYLYDYIGAQKPPPHPKSWLTDEETRLYRIADKQRMEIFDQLKGKLEDN